MINLGIIGTSAIAKSFVAGVKLSDKFELSAIYSRSYEKGAEFLVQNDVKLVFTDLLEMAKSDSIEAVYIASPNGLHYEQSKLFLENGKHVICEKPITSCAAEYKELKDLADRKGLIYMEAIIPIYTDGYLKVKEALSKIGDVKSARIDFSQYSSKMQRYKNGEKFNVFDMSLYGGTLMDLGVYCVWCAIDFFGMPKDITAFKNLMGDSVDGTGCAIFQYDDFNAILSYSKTGQSVIGSEIIGDKATLKIELISQYTGVYLVENGVETEIVGTPLKEELMAGEARRFADYILNYKVYTKDYENNSKHCYTVHLCMDKIKEKANIKYTN